MEFVVFECQGTLSLAKEARAAGFFVWIPTSLHMQRARMVRRVPDPCRGYIYLLDKELDRFRLWAGRRRKRASLMQIEIDEEVYPYRVKLAELVLHQKEVSQLDDIFLRRKEAAPDYAPQPGDPVQIIEGIFEGCFGTVQKIGKKEIRVLVGPRKIWFSADKLRKYK